MRPRWHGLSVWVIALFCALLELSLREASGQQEGARSAAISTVHPLATELARRIMTEGGNAVDAAVAAALTLGVVDGQNSGIGGGCFLLIRTSTGQMVAIDGRETAPARATRDVFIKEGRADPRLSQVGPLAVGVPGALAAYDYAVRRYGSFPLKRLLEAAAEVAERGFPIQRSYAHRLREVAEDVRADPGCRAILIKESGEPLAPQDWLVQPDLAHSYRQIAAHGPRWFYRGEFARQVDGWMKNHGGLVRYPDFAGYRIQLREPIRGTYRGHEIVGFPPPSSGGVHVMQILNILEQLDLSGKGRDSAEWIHAVAEAMKLAFADRAFWLGDPRFAKVPRGLIDKEYAASLARRIRPERVSPVEGHGTPPHSAEKLFGRHTTHFGTADAKGNWVACTATINTTFGAKVVVPGTGVFLNNEMDDFVAAPGETNFFGLVGGEANAVAAHKRPLSSMSPTIVLKNGRPVLSVGAAGGPTIISQTVLTLLGVLDFGMSVERSLEAVRFHHQWRPDELWLERSARPEVVERLKQFGHTIRLVDSLGACQAVACPGGEFFAAPDPRVEGKGLAW